MATGRQRDKKRGSSLAAALSQRPALGPRYQVGESIGQGGMSQVYRAYDRARAEDVAVKVLQGGSQGSSLGAEFRYIASLDHPGVVKVHDFGLTTEGRPFFTMELLDSGTLFDLPDAESFEDTMCALRAAFETLAFVHARGIVHGDLKPSNILMGEVAGRRFPKLLDFGIAWDRDEAVRNQGGTAHFMAPELILRGQKDHRCDLYAMGVVMYLLLTGTYPFESDRPRDLFMMHLQAPVPDPRDVVPEIDGELAEIALRLLEKRAADRFPSAREVVVAIDGWLSRVRTEEPPASSRAVFGSSTPSVDIAGGSRFVGHDGVLRQVLLRAVSIPSDGGGLFLVAGESGSGKTRLLQELRVKLQLGGTEFISVDLKGCRTGREPLERIGVALNSAAGNSLALVQLLAARVGAPDHGTPLADQLIVEAERLAKSSELVGLSRATVLALEDLDSVPDDAVRALCVFIETITRGSRLVVATHRASDCLAAKELGMLERSTTVELRRLGKANTAEVVRSLLGEMEGADAINDHVYHESGGNPAAIERVVRALIARNAIVVRGGRWLVAEELDGRLPVMSAELEIRAIAAALIDGLQPRERLLAGAAAHIDERFDADLLAAAVMPLGVEGLKTLVAAQVIEIDEYGGDTFEMARYRFTQRALRGLLIEQISHDRTQEWSARILGCLERRRRTGARGYRPELEARHLVICGRLHEAAALAGAQVIEASALGAESECAVVLRELLTLPIERTALTTNRWCELAMDLADMDRRRGATSDAEGGYRTIISRAQPGDPQDARLRAAALRKLGDLLMHRGDGEGGRVLEDALAEARRLGLPHLVARAAYALADHAVLAGRHEQASTLLLETLSLAGPDDGALKGRTLRLRARLNWMRGQFKDAEADARAAAEEYRVIGDAHGIAMSIGVLGNALYSLGRLAEARAAYVETVGQVRSGGWLTMVGKAEHNIALIDFYSDDWDAACEHWQAAIAIVERTGDRVGQASAMHNIACVAARRGEYKTATRLFERAAALAMSAQYPPAEAAVEIDVAQMCLDRGHLEAACEHAARGIEIARSAGVVDKEIAGARCMLELQLLDGRAYERIVADALALLDRADQVNVAEEVPLIRRVLGTGLARSGRRQEAMAMFAKAEEGFESFGSRYEAARVVRVMAELAGEGLLPKGKLPVRLRDAAKLFRRLRAQPELDLLRAARSKLGDVRDTTDEVIEGPRVVEVPPMRRSTVPPKPPASLPSGRGLDNTVAKWPEEEPSSSRGFQLDQLARELTGILELDRLLERTVDRAIETTGSERGLVIACDRAGQPRVRVSRGIGGVDLDGDDLELSRSVVQQVMSTRARVMWHRASAPPAGKLRESVARLGLCAVVGVPMSAQNELIGVLYLDSRKIAFEWDRDRVERLEQLAEQAAMALVNARKFDEQREKTEALAAAARELRDPLETALEYVERLKAQVADVRSPVAECVHALAEQTQRLGAMLSRMLEVAAVDPADLGWSMVSIQLKELIETALVPVRALAAVVDVELSTSVPRGLPTIFGNRARLIHVVESLMGEAVRASDPRARVSLHVTTAKAPTGMPAHAVDPLLIEPGDYELSRDQVVRIEVSRGAHEEGTDDEVGHAIARKIVARHGGLMWTEATAEGVRTMLCFPVLLQKKAAGAERTAG